MADLEDLARRVADLEERLHMEAGLSAGRDRDVSDIQVTLRSHTRMLEALRETQVANAELLLRVSGESSKLQEGQATILEKLDRLLGER